MLLRGLIYFATLYQVFVKENGYDLYGSQRIELPFPNYIVFYNGSSEEPDETELFLSESFQKPDRESIPSVECRVKVLNINHGHNRELMEKCRRLREYADFIHYIKLNLKNGMMIQEAVSSAMDTCEKQGILADLLVRCRTEVLDMLPAEYDEQKTMEYIRREEREIGERIGEKKGEALLSELLSYLLADNRLEDIRLIADNEKVRERLYKEYGLPKEE